MSIDYDNEIHQLLQNDTVPPHADTFYADLQQHLDNEIDTQTEPAPSKVQPITHRHRRFFYYGSMFSTAAAIVAVAMFAQSAFIGNSNSKGFNPTLASEVISRATSTYAEIHALTGTMVTSNIHDDMVRTRNFRMVEDGSYRSTTTRKSSTVNDFLDTSFDATSGRSLSYSVSEFPNNTNVVATEIDAPGGAGIPPLGFSLSQLLNGLSIDQHPEFRTVTENGRRAWLIHARTDRRIFGIGDIAEYNLDEVTAVFDQTTLLPIRIEAGGFTTTFTNMTTLKETPSDMSAQFPAGVTPTKLASDPDTVAMSREQLRSFDPTIALDLTAIPNGYKPGAIVVNKRSHNVMTTFYRGLQSFTYILTSDGNQQGNSPLSYGEEFHRSIPVRTGAFAGSTADLKTDFAALPQITATKGPLNVWIYGEVTGDELVDMVNGLTAP